MTTNVYTNPTLGLYTQSQFIGADGNIGTTVYKHLSNEILTVLKKMIIEELDEVEFHTETIDGEVVSRYEIIRSGKIFTITKKSLRHQKMYVVDIAIVYNKKSGMWDIYSTNKGKKCQPSMEK